MIIGHYYSEEIWAKGGIASYVRRISTAQRLAGHQVYYFSGVPCEGQTEAEQPIIVLDNAELWRQASQRQIDILHLHSHVTTLPPEDLPVIRTLHNHHPYCPSGSKYLPNSGHPCDRPYSLHGCLWGHLVDHCGSMRPHNIYDNFQRIRYEKATLPTIPTITVSQFLKNQMIRSGYPADFIHVLHLFAPEVANTSPSPEMGIPRFVFLGRIAQNKGLDWLLKALQQVKVPVHLDIAGDGYYEPTIRQLANRLGLDDRVTFHGWSSQHKVEELLRSARALIFPSLWHEPGGTVAFEAMANARAVIMSRVGGMPEVVHHEVNGLLVEPNNISGLTHSIEWLAKDWSLSKGLGEKGRKMAIEDFPFNSHFDNLMQLYTQVIYQKNNLLVGADNSSSVCVS